MARKRRKAQITFAPIELKKKGEIVEGGKAIDLNKTKKRPILGGRAKAERENEKRKEARLAREKAGNPDTTNRKTKRRRKAQTIFAPIELKKKGEIVEGGKAIDLNKTKKRPILDQLLGTGDNPVEPLGQPLPISPAGGVGLLGKSLGGKEFVANAQSAVNKIKVSTKAIKGANIRLALKNFANKKGQINTAPGRLIQTTGRNTVLQNTFKSNTKTQGLSKSLMGALGLSIAGASLAVSAIGTYPFAGFIKEEALQTLSFATKVALDSGDLEGAQAAIDQVNEILNAAPDIIDKIPFANVQKQLLAFFEATATKNLNDQKSLDKQKGVAEGDIESDFARDRRISDEAAFDRKRDFAEEEDERFEEIRKEADQRDKEKRERDTASAQAESERFEEIEAERTASANEEKRLNSIYFQLLRDKKFEEAEEFRIINFPTE